MGTHPIFESDFDCLTEKMSEQNISDLIANNTSLTASLARVIAEKDAMEKRMGQQISKLRNGAGQKRKSTEMDDADSPLVEVLRHQLKQKQQDITNERRIASYQKDESANLIDVLRENLKDKDDELKKTLSAKDKMKIDADKRDEASICLYQELAGKFEKLKANYNKEHDELKSIKRLRGPLSSLGSFINFNVISFLSSY